MGINDYNLLLLLFSFGEIKTFPSYPVYSRNICLKSYYHRIQALLYKISQLMDLDICLIIRQCMRFF